MPTRRRIAPITAAAIMLAVIVLVGCNGGSDEAVASLDVATPPPPSVSPTPTLNSKQLFTLHVEQTHAAERTAFALSGIPTWTPGAPRPYTGPTMTPVLGLLRGCANTSSLEPYMISCWAGWYDGHIMGVRSGREGRAGDITQGLIRVYNTDTQELHFYRTPDKAGAIQITAIDGTLFTLTTVDHTPTITYTFDLATRQWVDAPTLGPSSTVPVPPTLPPMATMFRDQIPGTQAPTRVYQITTPQYAPTRGLGDPNLQSDFDTRVAQNKSARWTALALTPSSTRGTATSTHTPVPTATEIIGPLECGSAANSYENQYEGCWQLFRDGQLYSIRSGRQGRGMDMGQGIISVRVLGTDNWFHEIGTYLTPSRQGSVEIASIDGTRVYLVHSEAPQPPDVDVTPIPNFLFIFDLATLQWVSP